MSQIAKENAQGMFVFAKKPPQKRHIIIIIIIAPSDIEKKEKLTENCKINKNWL